MMMVVKRERELRVYKYKITTIEIPSCFCRQEAERLVRDENLPLFTIGHHLQLLLYLSKTCPVPDTNEVSLRITCSSKNDFSQLLLLSSFLFNFSFISLFLFYFVHFFISFPSFFLVTIILD